MVTKDIVGDDTVVKIFGDPKSVSRAKALILDLTKEPMKLVVTSMEEYLKSKENEKPKPLDWKKWLDECVSDQYLFKKILFNILFECFFYFK